MSSENLEKQQLSEDILQESNHFALKAKTPLEVLTQQTYDQIVQQRKHLCDYNLKELKRFADGLAFYKNNLNNFRQEVEKQIQRKQKKQKKKQYNPTTAQRAKNFWAAIYTIILALCSMLVGGASSISRILSIENKQLKQLLIIAVLVIEIVLLVIVYKFIWPLRDIDQFHKWYKNKNKIE